MFDGSAKLKGKPSLNECLYSGQCLLNLIFSILLRFQMFPIGVISDIKQAFLNVGIAKNHRDYLRFLWFDDVFSKNPNIIIFRFLRVLFGLVCSPFLLNATIQLHMNQPGVYDPAFVQQFLRDLYIDDSTVGVHSNEEGFKFHQKAKSAMKDAGFDLRKWASNSKDLIRRICKREGVEYHEEDVVKGVLGLQWDTLSDTFVFSFLNLLSETVGVTPTKRFILRIAASFYDPIGWIIPIIIQARIIFQSVCKTKVDWDDSLNDEIVAEWENVLRNLGASQCIRIDRYVFSTLPGRFSSVELFRFSDASKKAYAAVCYVKVSNEHGAVTRIITAKAKVAPLKLYSVPRLELLACLLLSCLITKVRNTFKGVIDISRTICWTDSEICLHWINGVDKQWKCWVENRANKIREVKVDGWRYVPSKLNPADIPTKNIEFECILKQNELWWKGPPFLLKDSSNWPVKNIVLTSLMTAEVSKELNVKDDVTQCLTVNNNSTAEVEKIITVEITALN